MVNRRVIAALLALACAGCAAPFQRTARLPAAGDEAEKPRVQKEASGRPSASRSAAAARAASPTSASSAGWRSTGSRSTWRPGPAWAAWSAARTPPAWMPDELQTFITTLDWDRAVRRVDVRVQEHPAQGRRARLSVAPRVRPQGRHRAADRPQQRPGRRAAARPHCRAVLRRSRTSTTCRRRSARWPSISCRRSRSSCAAGSLADAMRATMSLPLIFPPTEVNGQVLIDGGTMNNVPADVVKAMGANRVIAVNVGDLSDREGVSYTMLGVAGDTLDAMMRASTRRALTVGGRRHQRAAREVWLARLAAGRRADRRGLPGGRGHARSAAAARRERGGVRGVAPRPPGAPPERRCRRPRSSRPTASAPATPSA